MLAAGLLVGRRPRASKATRRISRWYMILLGVNSASGLGGSGMHGNGWACYVRQARACHNDWPQRHSQGAIVPPPPLLLAAPLLATGGKKMLPQASKSTVTGLPVASLYAFQETWSTNFIAP